jgi:hypothetical protein
MSFPWSYSVLGLVPGLILTVVIAGIVLYTSLIIWYVNATLSFDEPMLTVTSGGSVCATLMSATCVISANTSSGDRRLPGI